MIDQQKRTTLKTIGAATAIAAIPSSAVLAGTLSNATNSSSSVAVKSQDSLGVSDLKIEIYSSTSARSDATRYNTVILTNLTNDVLPVKHFKPGSIVWEDQYLDLNSLRGHVGLTLAPGSAMNLSVFKRTIQLKPQSEYIWADDAVSQVDRSTDRVLLGAFISDGQLHAYPIPIISQFA